MQHFLTVRKKGMALEEIMKFRGPFYRIVVTLNVSTDVHLSWAGIRKYINDFLYF